MKPEEIIGKPVVSLDGGMRVGKVKDLILKDLSVASLLIDGDNGGGILPFSCVSAIGADAITIQNTEQILWNSPTTGQGETTLHDFLKLNIVDAAGTALGHADHVTLDATGKMQELVLHSGGVFGIGAHEQLIPAANVRAVGPKLITVDAAAV